MKAHELNRVYRMGWYAWWWMWAASISGHDAEGFYINTTFHRTYKAAEKSRQAMEEEIEGS